MKQPDARGLRQAAALALWMAAWFGGWSSGAAQAGDVAFIGIAPSFVAASPGDGSIGLTPNAALTWSFTGASTYDLYFGTTNPPPLFAAGLTGTTAAPAQTANTQYYWQVDAINGSGNTPTAVFTFTTGAPASSSHDSGPCVLGGRVPPGWAAPLGLGLGVYWVWRRIRRRPEADGRNATAP